MSIPTLEILKMRSEDQQHGSLLEMQTLKPRRDPQVTYMDIQVCEGLLQQAHLVNPVLPASQHRSGEFPSLSASPVPVTSTILAVSQLPHSRGIWAAVHVWLWCFWRVIGATHTVSIFHNNIWRRHGCGTISGEMPLRSGTKHLNLSNVTSFPQTPHAATGLYALYMILCLLEKSCVSILPPGKLIQH